MCALLQNERGIAACPLNLWQQVTQAARVRWDGASRAGSVLAADEDFYALLDVPRDASPEHIKKQVGRGQKRGDHLPTAA